MLPSTGLGASNAFQDAVVLANCLFNMPDVSPKSITAAFQEYYRQRFHRVSAQYEDSNMMAKSMLGQVSHVFGPLQQQTNLKKKKKTSPSLVTHTLSFFRMCSSFSFSSHGTNE